MRPTIRVIGDKELIRALEELGDTVSEVLETSAMAGAEKIRDEANRRAPGPHNVIAVEKTDAEQSMVAIGPDKAHWYYMFFETGAAPHAIKPHVKKALRFQGEEGEVLRWAVQHPGMAKKPFLRPGFRAGKDSAVKRVGEVVWDAIRRVARG